MNGIHVENAKRELLMHESLEKYLMKKALIASWEGVDPDYVAKLEKEVVKLRKQLRYRAAL